jgi:diaminohydroxyphosphoribosylaminopyrimidine deaminase/5-amino-6-(5-phosphoribosylamino)uracil reductase
VSEITYDSVAIDYGRWMKQAIDLAEHGRGRTRSNPMVGAVVLDLRGDLAGTGFHARLGAPHAERVALAQAGERASGGTVVVNLEPCCHHGRTPPCTDAIVESGVKRVVIAHRDPDPRVSGRGVATLEAAGIHVVENVETEAAIELNLHYLHYKQTGRPFVTLKLAMSLDGQVADHRGRSQWITSEACRVHAHLLRSRHDAILVGAQTARADNPRLTVRHAEGVSPQRFVLVGERPLSRDLLLFGEPDPAVRIGVSVDNSDWQVPADSAGLPGVPAVLDVLGRKEYSSLLVEGGPRTASSFIAAGCVERIVLYYGPVLLGQGTPALGTFAADLATAPRLTDMATQPLDGGFVVTGRLER